MLPREPWEASPRKLRLPRFLHESSPMCGGRRGSRNCLISTEVVRPTDLLVYCACSCDNLFRESCLFVVAGHVCSHPENAKQIQSVCEPIIGEYLLFHCCLNVFTHGVPDLLEDHRK